jgi:hypothetical protein
MRNRATCQFAVTHISGELRQIGERLTALSLVADEIGQHMGSDVLVDLAKLITDLGRDWKDIELIEGGNFSSPKRPIVEVV